MEDVEDVYELSPMQHGLLFDSVTVGDTGMYLIQLEYFLDGDLSIPHFETAWQRTTDRHPILRTSFHWDDLEKPLQVVHRSARAVIVHEDLSARGEDEREQQLAAFRAQDRRSGVDFEVAPLMRIALFRVGPRAFRLLWSFHHILMEGWSASIVLREVLARYGALVREEDIELAEHRPYRDFVGWIQAQDPERAERHWREELRGLASPTHLGIDRSPTTVHTPVTEYGGVSIRLSAERTRTLVAFAKAHGLTTNTLVQGAWALVVSRYSGDLDVVFGTIVSGRSVPLQGVGSMVGLFVNLLPSRVRTPPSARVVPWLQELQLRQAAQREFEHSSLAEVKGWSEIPAGLPLFESLLVFENWSGDLAFGDWGTDLAVADVHGHHGSPGYPLTVVAAPGPELTVGISYDLRRFDAESVRRLLASFETLLRGLTGDPRRRLRDVPVLDDLQRRRVLLEWNRTADDDLPREPVHRQVAKVAARTPGATAVVLGEALLTYRELDQRADALARELRAAGVAERSLVGLCVERDLSMIVGLLGILKAGCAYLPLDPSYPAERMRFLVEDSRVPMVVTQSHLAERIESIGAETLALDPGAALEADASPLHDAIECDDVAYVIYTSGSTGRPKGVMIPHGALSNYVGHAVREFGMRPVDRVLQFASISFDAAAEEIWPTLVAGGALVLRTDDMLSSVDDFLAACRRNAVTVVDFPTAYWHAVVSGLADCEEPFPASVRLAILGGERAKPEPLARWFDLVGDRPRLLNTYGPTETTIVATSFEVRASDGPFDDVPIGRPVRNVQTYVLDARGELVPLGVPGELHVGGAGVAVGYLGRPELTAERFVPDPFSGRDGARLYRTGDLVRHRSDGTLEFIGRIDGQVKFRGFRIELGEIEAALARHAGVEEAVVLLREDAPGVQRLVAYVVPRAPAPTHEALSRFLSERLPGPMVPSATRFLERLPLNSHGKVDRSALPAPEHSDSRRADTGFVAPRNAVEEEIAAIWRELLSVERVGVHDSFFDLGGHSLLLMQVMGRLKKRLGVRVTPGELVVPTLGQLAALCEERMRSFGEEPGLLKKLVNAIKGFGTEGPA